MTEARCALCGEPMPPGEEMFKYHGYSGPCPKPPLLADGSEKAKVWRAAVWIGRVTSNDPPRPVQEGTWDGTTFTPDGAA